MSIFELDTYVQTKHKILLSYHLLKKTKTMKNLIILFVLSILITSISCKKEDDLPEITGSWEYNYETLGDDFVSIAILQNTSMEGQVNENGWIEATISGDKAILRLPITQFLSGENVINVRSLSGDSRGMITSKYFFKGSYNFEDNDSTSFNVLIKTSGNIVRDAIIQIRNAKGTDDWDDDVSVFMIPDDEGYINANGMVELAQFYIESEEYILYDTWYEGTFNHTANLIKPILGTEVFGTFLIHTLSGEVPITENHGDIAGIGVQYPDGEIGVSVCYLRYYGDHDVAGSYNQITGEYSVTQLGPGTYNSYCNILTPWGWNYIGSGTYSLNSGDKKEMNYTLETRIGTVSGSVTIDGNLIENCNIRIYKDIIWNGNSNRIYSDIVQTVHDGSFTIESLYGDCILMISRVNYDLNNIEDAEKVVEISLNSSTYDIGNILLN